MFIVQLSLQSMPVLLRWLRGWRDERIKFQTPHPRTFGTRKEVLKSLKYKSLKKKKRLPELWWCEPLRADTAISAASDGTVTCVHIFPTWAATKLFQKSISHHVWDQVTQVHGWTCPKQLTKEAIVSTSQREARCGDGARACIPFTSQK